MPSTVAEKTWVYPQLNGNFPPLVDVPTTYQTLIHAIKNLLVANGWTVKGSSNSVTAALDGVDRLNSISNWIVAGSSGVHSWIVLENVDIAPNFQLCLDYFVGGSPAVWWQRKITVVVSGANGFTGGTTATRPTATDEVVVGGGNGLEMHTGSNVLIQTKLNYCKTTDNKHHRFYLATNGLVRTFICFEAISNASYSPGWVACWTTNTAAARMVTHALYADAARLYTRFNGATATVYMTGEACGAGYVGELHSIYPNQFTNQWPASPIGLASNTAGAVGRIGRMVDLWWASTAPQNIDGTPSPSSAQIDFIQINEIIQKWDGSTPLQLS
jgi:hypothetical protein